MTRRPETLTADAILCIPLDRPEKLFTGDPVVARQELRRLVSLWHPDRHAGPRATEVFQWVQKLYDVAVQKLAAGIWEEEGVLQVPGRQGSTFRLSYVSKHEIDPGTLYVGENVLAFDILAPETDLADHARQILAGLTYASAAMQREFSRYFPQQEHACIEKPDGGYLLVYKKAPDMLLLQDVLAHFNGKLPPRHVSWIISRLLNIACYFERQGKLAHNAIAPDSVFISPAQHHVALMGGWWFAARLGEPMLAASPRLARFAPPDVMQNRQGDVRSDMEMIRALGRELLGDISGTRLAHDASLPPPLVAWLLDSSTEDAVNTFRHWQEQVLVRAFGQRRFVPLPLTHQMLYGGSGLA